MPSYHNVPRQPFAGRSGNTMHSGMGGQPKPVDSVKSLNEIAQRDAAVGCEAPATPRRVRCRPCAVIVPSALSAARSRARPVCRCGCAAAPAFLIPATPV